MKPANPNAQSDVVILSLLNLGGDRQMVDLEHVAVHAHKQAPDLFRWRHYDLPSVETVRMAFRHANERAETPLVSAGDGGQSRMLTASGIRRGRQLSAGGKALRETRALSRPMNRELARMLRHPAFLKWRGGGVEGVSVYDLADLLNCQPSAQEAVFQERITRAHALATARSVRPLDDFFESIQAHLGQLLKEQTH